MEGLASEGQDALCYNLNSLGGIAKIPARAADGLGNLMVMSSDWSEAGSCVALRGIVQWLGGISKWGWEEGCYHL